MLQEGMCVCVCYGRHQALKVGSGLLNVPAILMIRINKTYLLHTLVRITKKEQRKIGLVVHIKLRIQFQRKKKKEKNCDRKSWRNVAA